MRNTLFALGIGAALVLSACGGGSGPAGGNPPPPPPPPPPTAPPAGANVVFDIVDNAFVDPGGRRNTNASVTIAAGQTVGWTHNGSATHTVTFTSVPQGSAGAVDSGNLVRGETHTVTLNTPGTYVFRCDFHPGTMRDVTIVVT